MKVTAPWPLIGRAEELNIVASTLDGSDDSAGMIIAGHAGVGKTRLAREAAARAAELGWTVRWVAGTAAAQPIPLGAFAQWATVIDGDPLRIVSDVIAAITASPRGEPVLVAVDDAHLLDGLSAFVLYQLVLRRAATVIATLRTGEHVPDAVTALWKDTALRRLDLQPLSRLQCDNLLEQVLGGSTPSSCSDRLWRLTFGNVLFLRQLVIQEVDAERLIAGDDGWTWDGRMTVTASLLDLIDTQIGAVSDAAGDVIDMVAIAEPLELDCLKRLTDYAAIEYCEQRGLVVVSPAADGAQHVRVGHPLYAEARRAQIGSIRLARLCGQIALAMVESGTAEPAADPVRLGRLWLQSDLPPNVDILMRAAQVAHARHDIDLTSRFAESAVAAGAGAEARLLLAHTLMLSDTPERAQEILDQLALDPLPDIFRSAVGQLRAANLLWPLGRPDASWDVIEEALANSTPEVAAEARAFRTMQLAFAAKPSDAIALSSSIDQDRLGKMPTLMLAWALTIASGDLGKPSDALAAAKLAETATAWPAAVLQSPASALVAVQALILAGEIAAAREFADTTYRQWAEVPGVFRTFAAAIDALASLGTGDVRSARARLYRALDEFTTTGSRVGAHYCLLLIYLETVNYTGDLAAIAEASGLLQRHHHPAFVFLTPYAEFCAAWAMAADGRIAQARAGAEAAAACARQNGQPAWEVRCRQAAVQFGDTRQAPRLAELSTQVGGPRAALAARWADALAHPNPDELSAVSSEFEAIGDRIAAADAAAHAATAYRKRQQRGPALTAAARATRLISECGATTPATRDAATPLPLTDRERQIAELVAKGLSNKQIADELTLSVRTVEGNIYRSCVKLDLSDRIELGRLMSELTAPTSL